MAKPDALTAITTIDGYREVWDLIAWDVPVCRVCDFCLIFVPLGHFDEPETLPYAIRLVCSIDADVRQTGFPVHKVLFLRLKVFFCIKN